MTPDRLDQCLQIVRWPAATLAAALDIDVLLVERWRSDQDEIPGNVASWIEALTFTHEASHLMRPSFFEGSQGEAGRSHPPEHIPVYSYNLLRRLGQGRVPLRTLFGTDDEAAVYFLVSRGLANREGDDLVITGEGTGIGTIVGS